MKNLLAALIFALFAQTANAQLAAEGLVIGLKTSLSNGLVVANPSRPEQSEEILSRYLPKA